MDISNLAVGGLVAGNGGTITQSYATGSVWAMPGGPNGIGALVFDNGGTINQSFATGAVTGRAPYGIAFRNGLSGHIANDVYWNKDTTNATSGADPFWAGGPPASNGLTTAQMSNPASFVGWNFGPGGDWVMPAGGTHPALAWQFSSPGSQ